MKTGKIFLWLSLMLLFFVCLALPLSAVSDRWKTGTNIGSVVRETQEDGKSYLRAKVSDRIKGNTFSAVFVYAEQLNLLEKTAITIKVRVPVQTAGIFGVHTVLYSGVDIFQSEEMQFDGGEWYTLTVDISGWQQRSSIDGIEIIFTDENNITDTFDFTDISTQGKADLTHTTQFLTFSFTSQSGTATYRENAYVLDAGEDGALTLLADAARKDYATADGIAYLAVTVEGAKSGGVVSLAVSDGNVSSQEFTIASSANMLSGRHTYLLPYDSAVSLHAYRLTFRGLYAEKNAVLLCSVSAGVLKNVPSAETVGKLTECSYSTEKTLLTVEGTVNSTVVSKHMNGTLALYALPIWAEKIDFSAPLATVRMSTHFTFSVNMTGKTSSLPLTQYVVYLVDGNDFLPVTAACYISYETASNDRTLSAVGICDCGTGGAFTANASAVMVDIDFSALQADGNKGKIITAGGQTLYLDTNTLHDLDESTEVPLATGVDVYFRLFNLPSECTEKNGYILSAMVNALADRYSEICGIIVQKETTDMQTYADILRIVYNTAAVHVPDIFVIATFGEEQNSVLDVVTLSQAIQTDGVFPWGLLWKDTNTADALTATQNLTAQCKTLALSVPTAVLHLWQPDVSYTSKALLHDYNDACSLAVQNGLQVLFLSLKGRTDTETIFEGLKAVTDGTNRTLSAYSALVLSANTTWKGLYMLADFSHSFSTYGWKAGDGCSRLTTKESDLEPGERTLNAVFLSSDGNADAPVGGTILSLTRYTDNFTYAPYLCFMLRLLTQEEATDTAEIIFHFGSGDHRAEYTVTVPAGQPLYLCCDLSEFSWADKVDFMAITVHCDSAATMDIYSIAAGSDEYSDENLSFFYRYRTVTATEEKKKEFHFTRPQILTLTAIVLLTVSAIALLSRHREERDK